MRRLLIIAAAVLAFAVAVSLLAMLGASGGSTHHDVPHVTGIANAR